MVLRWVVLIEPDVSDFRNCYSSALLPFLEDLPPGFVGALFDFG